MVRSWGWGNTENKFTCLLGIPFYGPGHFGEGELWDIGFQFFQGHVGGNLQWICEPSFYIWMGPCLTVPFVGCNFRFFSFQLPPPLFLKPERYQQSSKSSSFEFNKSQIPTAGSDPKSFARAFSSGGTPADSVFSRNVILGMGSLKMSVKVYFLFSFL